MKRTHRILRIALALLLCLNSMLTPAYALVICPDNEHIWDAETGRCTACWFPCEHVWDEGICSTCGYECEHDSWNEGICTTCGFECKHSSWNESKCTTCGYECEHGSWNESICSTCGYECEHLDTYEIEKVFSGYSYKTTETTHTATIKLFTVTFDCYTCGQNGLTRTSRQPIASEDQTAQNHDWADSKCTVCDYECKHPSYEGYDAGYDYEYESVSETQHEVIASTYIEYLQCSNCGHRKTQKTPDFDGVGDLEDHSFANGKCKICEHVCEHSYNSAGKCEYCSFACPHGSWNGNICSTCGYECKHDTRTETSRAFDSRVYHSTAAGHMIVKTIYNVTFNCTSACKQTGLTEKESVPDMTGGELDSHDWSDGKCLSCGYECEHDSWDEGKCTACNSECAHDGAEFVDDDTKLTFQSVSETQHKLVGKTLVETYYCATCGHTFEQSTPVEDGVGEISDHSFIGPLCEDCSYECTHKWDSSTGECQYCLYPCIHDDEEKIDERTDKEYSYDDETHLLLSITFITTYSCPECRHVWDESDPPSDNGIVYLPEPHVFTDGKCYCSYECPHSWNAETGICSKCETECAHSWDDDPVCTVCGYECEHDSWDEGECTTCGYECAHDDAEYLYDDTKLTFQSVSETQHKLVDKTLVETYYCSTCGHTFEQSTPVEDGVGEISDHSFNGPRCQDCSYDCSHKWDSSTGACQYSSYPCSHDDKEAIDWQFDDKYTYNDETHTMLSSTFITTYSCPECGHVWDESETTTDSDVPFLPSKHNFTDGKCYCGYECPHSWNAETGICSKCEAECPHTHSTRDTSYYISKRTRTMYLSPTSHYHIDVYTYECFCDVCGKLTGTVEKDEDHSGFEAEPHDFVNAKCTICGFNCSCEWYWQNGYGDKSGVCTFCGSACEDHEFAYNDADLIVQCTKCLYPCPHNEINDDYKCILCGLECIHSWVDGVCCICGYCDHALYDTISTESSTHQWEKKNATHHLLKLEHTESVSCANCSTTLSSTTWYEDLGDEPHNFQSDACIACGEPNPCTHPESDVATEQHFTALRYIDITAGTHTAVGDLRESSFCNACGGVIVSEVIDSNHSEILAHNWQDGVCTDCQHVNTCEHPEDKIESELVYEGGDWYYSTADLHFYDGWIYDCCICKVCNMTISQELITDNSYYEEAHTYDDDHFCSICLAHCFHNDIPYEDVIRNERYEPDDSTHHSYIYDIYSVLACESCGTVEEYLVAADTVHYQTHTMTDGVCELCGYEATDDDPSGDDPSGDDTGIEDSEECPHDGDTFTIPTSSEPVYESAGNSHHNIYTTYSITTYCDLCNLPIDCVITEENVLTTAAHTWVDDVCSECGHENTCEHPEDQVTEEAYWIDFTCTCVDDTHHSIDGTLIYETVCNACQMPLEQEIDEDAEPELEAHSFDKNNVCVDCGYESIPSDDEPTEDECEHPEETVRKYVGIENPIYTPIDRLEHRCTGALYSCFNCLNCDTDWDYQLIEEDYTIIERHEFEDGVCRECGYELDCPHDGEPIRNVRYDHVKSERVDEIFHKSENTITYFLYCPDCFQLIGIDQTDEKHVLYERHTFSYETNECWDCGSKNTCQHPEDQWRTHNFIEFAGIRPKSVSDTEHEIIGFESSRVYCDLCGEEISLESGNELVTSTQPHIFNDAGLCLNCNYINTCKHPADSIESGAKPVHITVSDMDADGHTITGWVSDFDKCTVCGEYTRFDYVPVEDLTEAHTFGDDGICIFCGYFSEDHKNDSFDEDDPSDEENSDEENSDDKPSDDKPSDDKLDNESTGKPEDTITDKPTTDDEDVDIADPDKDHSSEDAASDNADDKTAGDEALPPRMATSLLNAIEAILTEDEDALIRILNVELLLTEDELTAFELLTVDEQILVLLNTLGYQNEVLFAVEEMELIPSKEMLQLTADISKRINAMTDEEKSAFDALLEEHFPVEIIESESGEIEVITIQLEITSGEDVRLEQHSFFSDENACWISHEVTVTEIETETVE